MSKSFTSDSWALKTLVSPLCVSREGTSLHVSQPTVLIVLHYLQIYLCLCHLRVSSLGVEKDGEGERSGISVSFE